MLELDLMFDQLSEGWDAFDERERGYVTLLAGCDDADLLHWWLGMGHPQGEELQEAVIWLNERLPPRR